MTLEGRVVLVTGGAKRLGQSIALALARRGASVVISYRSSQQEAQKTLQKLLRLESKASAIPADLTKEISVKRLMTCIQKKYGRLDVLINSAANFERTPFERLTEHRWDHALDTNLKGTFLCALHASRLMRRYKSGKIINIADWAGLRPYRNYLPYCVSKAGIFGLAQALAKELAPNIQVNAIAPGPILPPEGMSSHECTRILQRVPLKRWGSPDDIANTVLFLIEGTDFMTGSTVFVDGGQLIA